MKLKTSSLSAKLYRYFYETEKMPKSLCPYFWKLVVAYLLILPLEIIGLPYTIVMFLFKLNKNVCPFFKAVLTPFGILLLVALFFLLSPITQFFLPIKADNVIASGILDAIIIIAVVCSLITDGDFLVKDFVKAKVNKVCPRIDWE